MLADHPSEDTPAPALKLAIAADGLLCLYAGFYLTILVPWVRMPPDMLTLGLLALGLSPFAILLLQLRCLRGGPGLRRWAAAAALLALPALLFWGGMFVVTAVRAGLSQPRELASILMFSGGPMLLAGAVAGLMARVAWLSGEDE